MTETEVTQAVELLLCPFCGSKCMIAATLDDQYRPMCRTDGCAALDGYNKRADAIEAWNTRTQSAAHNVPVLRQTFPILNSRGAKIDMQLVIDHGKQAYDNHYQTVERLSERGGLSWCELHAVLHNRKWQKMDQNIAIEECRAIEARYLAAIAQAQESE